MTSKFTILTLESSPLICITVISTYVIDTKMVGEWIFRPLSPQTAIKSNIVKVPLEYEPEDAETFVIKQCVEEIKIITQQYLSQWSFNSSQRYMWDQAISKELTFDEFKTLILGDRASLTLIIDSTTNHELRQMLTVNS